MSRLDDLFAREARSLRRHELKMKKAEERLALIEADSGSYCLLKSIKMGLMTLSLLIISVSAGCTTTSLMNTPVQQEQVTECERLITQHGVKGDCLTGEIDAPKGG